MEREITATAPKPSNNISYHSELKAESFPPLPLLQPHWSPHCSFNVLGTLHVAFAFAALFAWKAASQGATRLASLFESQTSFSQGGSTGPCYLKLDLSQYFFSFSCFSFLCSNYYPLMIYYMVFTYLFFVCQPPLEWKLHWSKEFACFVHCCILGT